MDNFIKLIESSLDKKAGDMFIEDEIKLLFKNIAVTNNIKEADNFFSVLNDIQFILAKAVFKNKIEVSLFLRKFIHDFDRLDDIDLKLFLYEKIKTNEI